MNYLSLFSGAGGGDLAMQHLLGHRCVGYVEWEPYCCKVLRARIDDGFLDRAPIFGDVREFIKSGWAGRYRGVADLVCGGPPCQGFSVAGKQLGDADPRDMWPSALEVVRIIRPQACFFENSPNLITWDRGRYFRSIIAALAEVGLDPAWTVLGADDVSAPHRRKRLWILAQLADAENERSSPRRNGHKPEISQPSSHSQGNVPHPDGGGQLREPGKQGAQAPGRGRIVQGGQDVADAEGERRGEGRSESTGKQGRPNASFGGSPLAHSASARQRTARTAAAGEAPSGRSLGEFGGTGAMGDAERARLEERQGFAEDARQKQPAIERASGELSGTENSLRLRPCIQGNTGNALPGLRDDPGCTSLLSDPHQLNADLGRLGASANRRRFTVKEILRGGECWWAFDPADLPDAESPGRETRGDDPVGKGEGGERKASRSLAASRVARLAQSLVGRVFNELALKLDRPCAASAVRVPRVATGVPNRGARLKAIGNGQVPACAAAAYLLLEEVLKEGETR